jgi:hypothetical protein
LETGIYIGIYNRQGVTSRGMLDGGEQERELEKRYRKFSEAMRIEYPRTSAVLERIAKSYEGAAKRFDDEVEKLQW